jgi:hypothetical protein
MEELNIFSVYEKKKKPDLKDVPKLQDKPIGKIRIIVRVGIRRPLLWKSKWPFRFEDIINYPDNIQLDPYYSHFSIQELNDIFELSSRSIKYTNSDNPILLEYHPNQAWIHCNWIPPLILPFQIKEERILDCDVYISFNSNYNPFTLSISEWKSRKISFSTDQSLITNTRFFET